MSTLLHYQRSRTSKRMRTVRLRLEELENRVVLSAATHLVVTTEPPASITAGTGFGLTISAEDATNAVDTTFTGPITVALNGTGPLNGTLTVNAVAGVATFSALSVTTAAAADTITASDAPLTPGTSTPFAVTAAAATQLLVTAQPPASVTAGAPFGFTVTAEDTFGNVDTTFTGPVTAALTGTGPLNGTLIVNAVAGVATFAGLSVNTAATADTITATDAPLTPATTTPFAVVAAAATQLLVTTEPPASITVNAPFGLTVTAEDQFGNVATTFTGPVTAALNGTGTLGGTLTVNGVAGVATFTGLTVNTAGVGDTITLTDAPLTPAVTSTFNVIAAAATQLAFTAEPPASVTAGAPFGLTVSAENANGTVDTTFTGPITIALNGTGPLFGTLTVNAVAGVATFTGLSIKIAATADTITASDAPLTPATSTPFAVDATAATVLLVSVQPPINVPAGAAFGLIVRAVDQFGNVDPTFTGPVTVALNGTGPLNGTLTVNAVAGVATFAGLSVNKAAAADTITATDAPLTPATTTPFAVTATTATELLVTAQPPASITAGMAFGFTVTAEDPFGNVDTTFAGPVTAILTGTGTLNGTLTVDAVAGVATFTGLSINQAGTGDSIAATSIPLAPAVTNTFSVVAAAATQLVITSQPPASVAVGAPFGLTVSAEDQFGNVDPTFTSTVTVSLNGVGTLGGTLTANAVAGVATFTGLTVSQAGTGDTITAAAPPLTPATSTAFTVTAAATTGSISGTVFLDPSATGTIAPGDQGLAGRTVFVDMNNSGVLQPGDPQAVTDGSGNYTISGLAPGTYTLRVVTFPGDSPTPTGGLLSVTLTAGTNATGENLGLVLSSTILPNTPTAAPFGGATTAIEAKIDGLYHYILGRGPDPQGLAHWEAQAAAGASITNIATQFYNSTEYATDTVNSYYQTYLNRQGEASGVSFWVSQLQSGMSEQTVAELFLSSSEYIGDHSGNDSFVNSLYMNVLGRNAVASELSAWDSVLGAGVSKSNVVTDIVQSTESYLRSIDGYYTIFLARTGDTAGINSWLSAAQKGDSQVSIASRFLGSLEYSQRAANSIG